MPFGCWFRDINCLLLSNQSFNNFACLSCNYSRIILAKILMGVTYFMKVVVLKSPKFLRGILRLAFKIKKEDNE